jgi:hypothetical protein
MVASFTDRTPAKTRVTFECHEWRGGKDDAQKMMAVGW